MPAQARWPTHNGSSMLFSGTLQAGCNEIKAYRG